MGGVGEVCSEESDSEGLSPGHGLIFCPIFGDFCKPWRVSGGFVVSFIIDEGSIGLETG